MGDLKVFNEFIETSKTCELIVQMCFNSEFYKKQKIDLLSRLSRSNMPNRVKYCCIGSVNTEETALFHIKSREKYFRDSAEQRNLMNDNLNEFNIKNLTKFSLIFLKFFHGGFVEEIYSTKLFQKNKGQKPPPPKNANKICFYVNSPFHHHPKICFQRFKK